MKKISLALVAMTALLASCSDVDIPSSASDDVAPVSNLRYENPEGTREVTLRWQNPAGLIGIQLTRNSADITELGVVDNYFIEKAPINQDMSYTVKARYDGNVVSKGQTVRFNLHFDIAEAATQVAMLVPNDYHESADERAAVAWFEENYVNKGTGVLITPATINLLNVEKMEVCWVICDRVGIELGVDKLPGALGSEATLNALKDYGAKGGNLLLTNHATQLTVGVGRLADVYLPKIFGNGDGSGTNPDVWGINANIGLQYDYSSHTIYSGLAANTEQFGDHAFFPLNAPGHKGDHNCMWDMNLAEYGLVDNPNKLKDFEEKVNCTVMGTWQHVTDWCCAGVVDFAPTTSFTGRILAIGVAAYEWDLGGDDNAYISQVQQLTANCLKYLK